jgi:[acyl-carrier-protein] S-malonyltransferase
MPERLDVVFESGDTGSRIALPILAGIARPSVQPPAEAGREGGYLDFRAQRFNRRRLKKWAHLGRRLDTLPRAMVRKRWEDGSPASRKAVTRNPRTRNSMRTAFIFPGQGSQVVGMGRALADAIPAAREVFAEVDDALGAHLSTIIFEGPAEELTRTRNAQPALMAVSMAVVRALETEGIVVEAYADYAAGHSLGEYSALAAARTLSTADAARLLRIRGDAMQQAVPEGVGAMAAMLGLGLEEVVELAAEAAGERDICEVANDNAPGQVVVAGHKAAVERAMAGAKARGARALPLAVSAPFHCALMAPAAEVMEEALASTQINPPIVPVVANVIAQPLTGPDDIRRRLVEQVTGRVRWRQSIAWLGSRGVTRLIELGSGKVLTGLTRRILSEATARPVSSPEDVRALAADLRGADRPKERLGV